MNRSESIVNLAKSLSIFQGEVYNPKNNIQAHQYDYANLGQILEIVRPMLSSQKLSLVQCPEVSGNEVLLETVLFHESGEFISNTLKMPIGNGQNKAHAVGSSITYARRYALMSILGLFGEDDCGEGGTGFGTKKETPKAAPAPSAPRPEPTRLPTPPQPSKEMLEAINCLKEHYEDDDKLGSIDFFESFAESEKKVIWNHSENQVKVWLKNVMDNRPSGQ